MSSSTTFSNNFLDALLRLKCPPRHKELLLAVVRIIKNSGNPDCGASVNSLANYLGQDKSSIAKRLNNLIEANILREVRRSGYHTPRVLMLNINYSEWKQVKYSHVKTKKDHLGPNVGEDKKAASEKAASEKAASEKAASEKAAAQVKSEPNNFFSPKKPETPTVAITPTMLKSPKNKELLESLGIFIKKSSHMHPDFEKRYCLRKLFLSEKLPEKNARFQKPYKPFPKPP